MSYTKEQRLKNLEKANKVRKEKGYKRKTTILKEQAEQEARDYYISQILDVLPKITKQQIRDALTGNSKTAQYLINQLIGKPLDRQEVNTQTEEIKKRTETMRRLAQSLKEDKHLKALSPPHNKDTNK